MTHRFEGHVVDGEDVEVDQRLHHRVVQVASPVCHAHPLQVRVIGVEHEGVEGRFASRELVYDEVAKIRRYLEKTKSGKWIRVSKVVWKCSTKCKACFY